MSKMQAGLQYKIIMVSEDCEHRGGGGEVKRKSNSYFGDVVTGTVKAIVLTQSNDPN